MPLLKSIKDKQSTKRNKADKEDQRLLSASARNAKEKEFFEQKKKREAERKAAQERIKKAQSAIASRNSSAGVGSSVNSGKGNSPVTRVAMNAPSGSDDVNRAGTGGHNRANDNKGNQPRSGNLGGGGSSFSAMLAALAEENERRSGTGGHNIAGESDSRGQRFSDSAQRRSAIPASSLSNELDFSDDDKNKSWSQMVDDLQSQRRKPDTANGNTTVKEDTKIYNLLDEVLWRDAQDAMIYEDMKNGWKPNGDTVSAENRNNAEDVMSGWVEFTGGQIPIPDLAQFDNIEVQKDNRDISELEVFADKTLPGFTIGEGIGILANGAIMYYTGVDVSPYTTKAVSAISGLAGAGIGYVSYPSLKSAGPSESFKIIAYDEDQKITAIYEADKYSQGGIDMVTTYRADGVVDGYVTRDYYPYDSFSKE